MANFVLYERKGEIAYITLNRSERLNAFNEEFIDQMGKVWSRFKKDNRARVAILSGAGDHFCVGAEFPKEASPDTVPFTLPFYQSSFSICASAHEVWKPVIATIWGYCLGGGWLLAQDCDFRFAAENAVFGLPEVKWNLIPNFTGLFRRWLSPCLALEILLTGASIDAQRAYEIGFVNKVAPREQITSESIEFAEKICANGPGAVRRIKELFYKGYELSKDEVLELTWKFFEEILEEEDTVEGTNAFLNKKKPVYRGF